jgi:hypothetical protein
VSTVYRVIDRGEDMAGAKGDDLDRR